MILALLTGIVTIIYKILIGAVPSHIIILGFIGLIIIFLIILYALKIWHKMQLINKEMRDGYSLAILTSIIVLWFFYKITQDSQSISSTM